MWKLYNTIKHGLPEKDEVYLIHQLIKVLDGITTSDFMKSLNIMYGDKVVKQDSSEYAILFIKGAKKNNLFAFASTIRELLNGNAN